MLIRSSAHQDPRRLMVVIKTTVYFVGMCCVADSINPKDSNQFEILFSSYFIKIQPHTKYVVIYFYTLLLAVFYNLSNI